MIRPKPIEDYPEIDLKLAIKSSLPNVRATLALLIMMWKAADKPFELAYSQDNNFGGITISDDLLDILIEKYKNTYSKFNVKDDEFIEIVQKNQLFTSQLEALIVGIELVYRIAKIRFMDGRQQSAERTKGKRFPKMLSYTSNIDIIDTLISSNHKIYSEILLRWLGCDIPIEQTTAENLLVRLFTCLSENAVYRLESTEEEVIFNQNSIYSALLDNEIGNIDIDGDGEAKGSLRVLKSLLSENLSRYLVYSSKSGVMWSDARYWNNDRAIFLENYQSRVDTYLQLNIGTIKTLLQTRQKPIETVKPAKTDTATAPRKTGGTNRLLYGIPGSGKSHQAAQLCPNAAQMERVVFHPEYSYSDFVGQIMPIVDENKRVYYGFTPGPFTRILQKAYNSPTAEFFLIIEELNRGNAPAIFGEIFQLLDRNEDGTSSYGITNAAIAEIVYENAEKLVFLPSNLHIVATMNTSDQNVFTLDTAFQRRWRMQLVENDVKTAAHASYKIPTTTITWEKFSTVINKFILENSTNLSSTEDKRLGAYFVTSQDLEPSESEVYENFDFFGENTEKAHRFAEKVLKYLWDDVFKFSRSTLFDTTKYPSLESVIKEFTANTGNERLTKIFASNVAEELVNNG